jgi:hypothetical protein
VCCWLRGVKANGDVVAYSVVRLSWIINTISQESKKLPVGGHPLRSVPRDIQTSTIDSNFRTSSTVSFRAGCMGVLVLVERFQDRRNGSHTYVTDYKGNYRARYISGNRVKVSVWMAYECYTTHETSFWAAELYDISFLFLRLSRNNRHCFSELYLQIWSLMWEAERFYST